MTRRRCPRLRERRRRGRVERGSGGVMDHNQPTSLVGPLYPFEGKWPVLHPDAFVAPTAAVIGDVELGEGASVWYGCVLRGDTNVIRIGPRSNIQDGTIVHVNAGRQPADRRCGRDGRARRHRPRLHAGGPRLRGHGRHGAGRRGDRGRRGAGRGRACCRRASASARCELWIGNPAKLVRVLSPEQRAQQLTGRRRITWSSRSGTERRCASGERASAAPAIHCVIALDASRGFLIAVGSAIGPTSLRFFFLIAVLSRYINLGA